MTARILEKAPDFKVAAVTGKGEEREVSLAALAGRWAVVFFYPKDFTRVCPTEIQEFSKRAGEFRAAGAEVIGVSVDDLESHRRWIQGPLGEIDIALAADPSKSMARDYGALLEDRGVAARATFIVDPAGVVRYAAFHDPATGRSISEVLRVLEALQTGEKSPAEWRPGHPTLGR
ncbi:MAG TPA: peroxiredoxin [Anaeromyxobacteraceae bacterium]|nr:peroxiredoxin [Anaeromyxobacteraceae bacterium]